MAAPRVLVTRPQAQADDWVARLQALGVEAAALPLLRIGPAQDPRPLQQVRAGLARYAAVMFVSPNAVRAFFATSAAGMDPATGAQVLAGGMLPPAQHPTPARSSMPSVPSPASPPTPLQFASHWPPHLLAAGTGPGTAVALLQAGVPAANIVCPSADQGQDFDSEALWQLLRDHRPWAGTQALIVRGEGGRDWLAQALAAQGAQVHFVEAYRRLPPQLDAAASALLHQALARPLQHVWLFSSSEALGHLPALAPAADWRDSTALASHPRIATTASGLGFGRVIQVLATPQAVAAALTRPLQSPPS